MAVGALQVGVLAVQREGHLVVEAMQTIDAIVANQALRAELLGMFLHKGRVVICMAGLTGLRIEAEVLAEVAGFTGQGRLVVIKRVTGQGEACVAMVKGLALISGGTPIESGVAGGAIHAEHPGMGGWLGMAGHAFGLQAGKRRAAMAALAFQGTVVAGKRKAGTSMVKGSQRGLGRIELAPLVFAMAAAAVARLIEPGVQSTTLGKLRFHILVTFQTLAGLIGLEGQMAVAALCFKIRVRMKITQFYSGQGLGADQAGIEDRSAFQPQSNSQHT